MSAGQPGKGTEGTEAAVRAGGPPRHVGQPVSGGEGEKTVFMELLRNALVLSSPCLKSKI